jgi:hypothetical protein
VTGDQDAEKRSTPASGQVRGPTARLAVEFDPLRSTIDQAQEPGSKSRKSYEIDENN